MYGILHKWDFLTNKILNLPIKKKKKWEIKEGRKKIVDISRRRKVGRRSMSTRMVNVAIVDLTIGNRSILIVIIGVLIIVRSSSPVHG